jgi:pyruvate dehydrogenase E1 component alpha subunit
MADHTTSDDASRYRLKEEVEEWARRDPIDRLRKYMRRTGLWSEDYERKVQEEASEKVQIAVKKAESIQPPKLKDLFAWTFAQLPPHLEAQYEELRELEKAD